MPTPNEELRTAMLAAVTPDIKRRIWDEYIQTREGRQKLACSMIQPSRDLAKGLKGDAVNLDAAEKLLRNSIRLMGHMALDGETFPESLTEDLRRLRAAIEDCGRPTRWDRLIEDDENDVEF